MENSLLLSTLKNYADTIQTGAMDIRSGQCNGLTMYQVETITTHLKRIQKAAIELEKYVAFMQDVSQ